MRVIPEVNEIVELEESILIMNQIAKLENRIKMGGDFFFSGTSSWKFRSFFFLLRHGKNRLSWRTSGKTMDLTVVFTHGKKNKPNFPIGFHVGNIPVPCDPFGLSPGEANLRSWSTTPRWWWVSPVGFHHGQYQPAHPFFSPEILHDSLKICQFQTGFTEKRRETYGLTWIKYWVLNATKYPFLGIHRDDQNLHFSRPSHPQYLEPHSS